MKVLGFGEGYPKKYICEVNSNELDAVFDFDNRWSCEDLRIGAEVDLAKGYKFKQDLELLFKSFTESHVKFIKANEIMYNFAKGMIKND
jgi:hypothetical protein